jgi:hypothetical protein
VPAPVTFDEVLTGAVNFFVENGYTNYESIIYWLKRLEKAARNQLLSTTQLNEKLKYALNAEYIRLVERGLLMKNHPGIQKSTIARLRPQLRQALANRTNAAIALIRLAREEEIANTLRRFSGWASSLPPTPSPLVRQADIRRSIRAGLTQAALRERRLLSDQTRKLSANLHATTASAGGAIAARWISNWKLSNYDFREAHRELARQSESSPYLIRNSWAHTQGLLNTVGAIFTDQLPHQPAQVPYCRCYFEYIYALEDLPPSLVNKKAA